MSLTDIQDDFVKRFILMTDGGDAADLQEVLARLAGVEVPAGATAAEAEDISEQIALARELLREADVPMVIDQASIATGGAEQLVQEIAARIKKTGEEAADLLKRANGLDASLDSEVPSGERDKVKSVAAQIAGPLVGATDPDVVAAARLGIEKQEDIVASLNEAAERDREKRKQKAQELRTQVAKTALPKDAEDSEIAEAEKLGKKIDALPDTPTPSELAQAVNDLAAFTDYLSDLEPKLKERRERFAKVKSVLARLAADAPKLMPHKRAPAGGDAQNIAEDAKQLLATSGHLLEWSKVTSWTEADLTNLDKSCGVLEGRMDDLNGAITKKITEIEKAVQAVKTCIGTPKGRKFGGAQIAAFEQLIAAQTKHTDADLGQADTVISALEEQVTQLNELSVTLAANEARITAVKVPKDADLSAKEKAALAAAKKAAMDALDKVDEL